MQSLWAAARRSWFRTHIQVQYLLSRVSQLVDFLQEAIKARFLLFLQSRMRLPLLLVKLSQLVHVPNRELPFRSLNFRLGFCLLTAAQLSVLSMQAQVSNHFSFIRLVFCVSFEYPQCVALPS